MKKYVLVLVSLFLLANSVLAVDCFIQVIKGTSPEVRFTAYKSEADYKNAMAIINSIARLKNANVSAAFGQVWDISGLLFGSNFFSGLKQQANVSVTKPSIPGFANATVTYRTDANGQLKFSAGINDRIDVSQAGFYNTTFQLPDPRSVQPINSQNKFLAILATLKPMVPRTLPRKPAVIHL